jgi:hypothetical protein
MLQNHDVVTPFLIPNSVEHMLKLWSPVLTAYAERLGVWYCVWERIVYCTPPSRR